VKIIPLAADSLGVRSMATYVEAGSTGLLLDPGATLAPARYGLPPSEEEWEALRRANDRISAYAARARYIFLSHYHEDHFRSDPVSYAGRIVLAKDPRRMVTGVQGRRAQALWKALDGHAVIQAADSVTLTTRDLDLSVSPPLPHGLEGTMMGYVVALTVTDHHEHQRFVFASDVQGPLSPVAAAWLIQARPTTLYLSGPPSYIERELGAAAIERAVDHLRRIIDATGCRVIMDHHALRDIRFTARFTRLWETGQVVTAAGHLGLAVQPLESRREQLWAAVRKPPVKAAPPRPVPSRAIMTRENRRIARGGKSE
jgi:predicted metallo-beta-lactamase superfamily hydrolase